MKEGTLEEMITTLLGTIDPPDGENTYTMVYTYVFMDVCFILAEMLLPAVELEVSSSGPLSQQGPHHQQRSDENIEMIYQAAANTDDKSTHLVTHMRPPLQPPTLRPVPGCGRSVIKICNHLNQFHKT